MSISQVAPELAEWAAGWSAHDGERVVRLFTENCVYEDVTIGAVNHGKDELRAFAAAIFAAIPDFAIELSSSHAAERWAAMEWTMSGTHAADLPGLPATGKRFSVRGATVLALAPDGISRCTDYWDKATFAAQVGLDGAPVDAAQAAAKAIFVLQRRADITHEQCLEYWSGQHHTQLVSQVPGLKIRVLKARGQKCARCWNFSEHVGEDTRYPSVCERCSAALKEIEGAA